MGFVWGFFASRSPLTFILSAPSSFALTHLQKYSSYLHRYILTAVPLTSHLPDLSCTQHGRADGRSSRQRPRTPPAKTSGASGFPLVLTPPWKDNFYFVFAKRIWHSSSSLELGRVLCSLPSVDSQLLPSSTPLTSSSLAMDSIDATPSLEKRKSFSDDNSDVEKGTESSLGRTPTSNGVQRAGQPFSRLPPLELTCLNA